MKLYLPNESQEFESVFYIQLVLKQSNKRKQHAEPVTTNPTRAESSWISTRKNTMALREALIFVSFEDER